MTKRDSFEKTGVPIKPYNNFHDIGDGHSVDSRQNLLTFLWKFGWLITISTILLIIMIKALFPGFVEKNSKFFNKVSAVYWADQAMELTHEEGMRNFKLVGTGLHHYFKKRPEDRKLFFFDGKILMMKDYFTNEIKLNLENRPIEQKGVTDVPLTDIEQEEAQELCELLGARLPYYQELKKAEILCERHGLNLIKPNLRGCKFNPDKRMWTATAEPGFFFGDTDNFKIYQPGAEYEKPEYQDESFESGDIGFRCAKDVEAESVDAE